MDSRCFPGNLHRAVWRNDTLSTAAVVINSDLLQSSKTKACAAGWTFVKHINGNDCHGFWNTDCYPAALKHSLLQIFESNWTLKDFSICIYVFQPVSIFCYRIYRRLKKVLKWKSVNKNHSKMECWDCEN